MTELHDAEARKKSEAEAVERGRELARKEIACRMLSRGLEVSLVVYLSGLSESVVRSLACRE